MRSPDDEILPLMVHPSVLLGTVADDCVEFEDCLGKVGCYDGQVKKGEMTMTENSIGWPLKQRDIHNHHFDSTIWDDFIFRDDDIIISTYAKSGTTWLQQIVAQLLFPGEEGMEVAEMSPWMDLRVPPKDVKLSEVEAQSHRRFIKTHLPVDALVFSPQAKYLYIGRDGRDVVWSMYNHHANANDLWYEVLNDTPGRVGPPIEKPVADIRQYFQEWLAKDGYPWWSYWENIRTWWEIRHLPNVLFLHFSDMKKDMAGEMRRVAEFLDILIDVRLCLAFEGQAIEAFNRLDPALHD